MFTLLLLLLLVIPKRSRITDRITFLLTIDKVFQQLLCKQVTVKLNHMFS